MAEEKNGKFTGDMLANFDQLEAHMGNTAVVLGSYFKDLLENGIPADLAYKLVVDFHALIWSGLNRRSE